MKVKTVLLLGLLALALLALVACGGGVRATRLGGRAPAPGCRHFGRPLAAACADGLID